LSHSTPDKTKKKIMGPCKWVEEWNR
jgi:hypothetical protein